MKIIHLIPQDGLGGVEQAARSLVPDNELDIEVTFLCGKNLSEKKHIKSISKNKGLNSLSVYTNGFKYLLEKNPDLLICSLWRSSMVGLTYTFYRNVITKNRLEFIILIHASTFSHLMDKFFTKAAIRFAREVWCDSIASKKATFKTNKYNNKIKVISFLVQTDSENLDKKSNNNFVFWGRIAKVKGLDKAIEFFSKIKKTLPESLFYIYGPDCGELQNLIELVDKLQLSESVLFMGTKEPSHYPKEILSSKFFLNTSLKEGMAIAVTEAMQLGLVPIVTPVGEIGNYCIDGHNSIYFNSNTYQNVVDTIKDNLKYKNLSLNAYSYWKSKPDYSKDFNQNCLRVINDLH